MRECLQLREHEWNYFADFLQHQHQVSFDNSDGIRGINHSRTCSQRTIILLLIIFLFHHELCFMVLFLTISVNCLVSISLNRAKHNVTLLNSFYVPLWFIYSSILNLTLLNVCQFWKMSLMSSTNSPTVLYIFPCSLAFTLSRHMGLEITRLYPGTCTRTRFNKG